MTGEKAGRCVALIGRHKRLALSGLGGSLCAVVLLLNASARDGTVVYRSDLLYVNTSFENASPLYWETKGSDRVDLYLVYDQERSAPNRANGHWLFEVQAKPGARLTLVLHNFDNVWNGRLGSPISDRTICFVSRDMQAWRTVPTEKTDDNCLKVNVVVEGGRLYVARLEPYRLSDLESLVRRIRDHAHVQVTAIGKTVEGRELEIIRIGTPEAAHRVLLRARAHPWEAGSNWVVQGLVERLLRGDEEAKRYLDEYCVYLMPMANKDGVVRGRTRFNLLGADLNRRWDQPPDPAVNPENHALESWLTAVIAQGQGPHLMIDLHNDESGRLHISRPDVDLSAHLKKMELLEAMLRQHTWFTEGSTGANTRNPGSIGEGLLERFGLDACVLELNANWIAGLNAHPSAQNWKLCGAQLCAALFEYFRAQEAQSRIAD